LRVGSAGAAAAARAVSLPSFLFTFVGFLLVLDPIEVMTLAAFVCLCASPMSVVPLADCHRFCFVALMSVSLSPVAWRRVACCVLRVASAPLEQQRPPAL
jgi:hypothetical protein